MQRLSATITYPPTAPVRVAIVDRTEMSSPRSVRPACKRRGKAHSVLGLERWMGLTLVIADAITWIHVAALPLKVVA